MSSGKKLADRKTVGMALILMCGLFTTSACKEKQEYSAFEAFGKGANGLYSIRLTLDDGAGSQPVTGRYQRWIVHVQNAVKQEVYPATIAVTGGMPGHGHGLPTQPQVTQYLGSGQYLMEGLKLSMRGQWILGFYIAAADGTDTVEIAFDVSR